MNSPEIKIYKSGVSSQWGWVCETYTLGHLLTTCKRGRGGIICTARKCERTVDGCGFVGYTYDLGLDGSQAHAMAVKECRRATRQMVEDTHNLGLREFYWQNEEVTA